MKSPNPKQMEQIKALVNYSQQVWGDNAIVFLASALSTSVSGEQLQALIDSLKKKSEFSALNEI